MCLYPKIIINKKYTSTKKNGGIIPPLSDNRVKYVPVGCQKCIECRKQKAREWQIRLLEDIRHNKNGYFITLTFTDESILELTNEINDNKEIWVTCKATGEEIKVNNEKLSGYDLDNKIAKLAVRRFLERWRKKFKKSVRHWLVTELGHNGSENIHMHGIIWTNENINNLEKIWKYGYVWCGNGERKENYVNEKTVNYLTKYVTKIDFKNKYYKPLILTSAGIGSGYTNRVDSQINKFNYLKTKETYRSRTGHEMSLPIYWRNKIYSEDEREKLWIYKLDKEERYVLGQRIDISETDEYYMGALFQARKLNRELGYGTDEINWDLKTYENERRKLKQKERTQKAFAKKIQLKKVVYSKP